MSEQSGGGPITREQVERAIEGARNRTHGPGDSFGTFFSTRLPGYVLDGWREAWKGAAMDPATYIAALTRWRDELAAAEPVRGILTGEACDDCGAPCMYYSGGGGSVGCACGPPEPSGWRPPSDDAVREAEHCITAADYAASRAAAEPVRRVARWDAERGWYALTPCHVNGRGQVAEFIENSATARAWGYEIEGGPEPIQPAEDSPERLRERREALGWDLGRAAYESDMLTATDAHRAEGGLGSAAQIRVYSAALSKAEDARRHAVAEVIRMWADAVEDGDALAPDSVVAAAYAAAMSAEEERRAEEERLACAYRESDGTLVWDDSPLPEPERPAPRFKVGDWVRVTNVAQGGDMGCIGVEFRILSVFESDGRDIYVSPKHGTWEASHLEPASPPAPEVVDVPQPRIVVKRCDEVEAEWTSADATILIVTHDALDDAIFVPIALLRAMLAAIDAQQGGAS